MNKHFTELNLFNELSELYMNFCNKVEGKNSPEVKRAISSLSDSSAFVASGYTVKEKLKENFLKAIEKLAEFQAYISIMKKKDQLSEDEYLEFIDRSDMLGKKLFSYRKKVSN